MCLVLLWIVPDHTYQFQLVCSLGLRKYWNVPCTINDRLWPCLLISRCLQDRDKKVLTGNRMNMFLTMSVLQANFCKLEDVEYIMCPVKESVAVKNTIQTMWGDFMSTMAASAIFQQPLSPFLLFALGPHPKWPVMSGDASAGKLPSKYGCRL